MKLSSTTKVSASSFPLTLTSANDASFPVVYSDDVWLVAATSTNLATFLNTAGQYSQKELNEEFAKYANTNNSGIRKGGSDYSAIIGPDTNAIDGNSAYSSIIGSSNSIAYSTYVNVSGSGNTISEGSNYSVVNGSENIVHNGGLYNRVYGLKNELKSSAQTNDVFGDSNTIGCVKYSTISGKLNTTTSTAECVSIVGRENSIGASNYANVIGYKNIIPHSCTATHIEGAENSTVSGSLYTHIEGYKNTERVGGGPSIYSHIEGAYNKHGGNYNHVEGKQNSVCNGSDYVHIEGHDNTVNSGASNNHIEGSNHTLTGGNTYLHVEGYKHTLNGGMSYSHLEGYENTISSGSGYSHVEGQSNTVSNGTTHAHVEGCNNSVINNANYSHAGGSNNTITAGSQNSIIHGKSNNINYCLNSAVFGESNSMEGGSNNSLVSGYLNSISYSASNAAFGNNNLLHSTKNSIICGDSNVTTVGGDSISIFGKKINTIGTYSYSHAEGCGEYISSYFSVTSYSNGVIKFNDEDTKNLLQSNDTAIILLSIYDDDSEDYTILYEGTVKVTNEQSGENTITSILLQDINEDLFKAFNELYSEYLIAGADCELLIRGSYIANKYTHIEGNNVIVNNECEHAQGSYNKSHSANSSETNETVIAANTTLSSIGNGSANGRSNAFEVMRNGDVYITGKIYKGQYGNATEFTGGPSGNSFSDTYKNWLDAKISSELTSAATSNMNIDTAIDVATWYADAKSSQTATVTVQLYTTKDGVNTYYAANSTPSGWTYNSSTKKYTKTISNSGTVSATTFGITYDYQDVPCTVSKTSTKKTLSKVYPSYYCLVNAQDNGTKPTAAQVIAAIKSSNTGLTRLVNDLANTNVTVTAGAKSQYLVVATHGTASIEQMTTVVSTNVYTNQTVTYNSTNVSGYTFNITNVKLDAGSSGTYTLNVTL